MQVAKIDKSKDLISIVVSTSCYSQLLNQDKKKYKERLDKNNNVTNSLTFMTVSILFP